MLHFLVAVLCAIGTLLFVNHTLSRLRMAPVRTSYDYDVIVVGGSIGGPVMAKVLSDQGRKVLIVERTLFTKPDRIVGELLQPGGVNALREIGMQDCAESIGMPCYGYMMVDVNGKALDLPYRKGARGTSFHFGDFVQNLRSFVFHNCKENVTMVEGTVNRILTEGFSFSERAYGIEYTVAEKYEVPANPFREDPPKANSSAPTVRKIATAPLIVMCDGGMSKWKSRYQHYTPAADYHSNFIGFVMKGVVLPKEQRGTVVNGKTGPILSYRLDDNEVRVLVDYNKPTLPSLEKQSEWLITEAAPFMPEHMREEFIRASRDTKNIRSMPIARYPPAFPCIKGYVGIGDHANQRHPLTGGGMTCCIRDAIRLAGNLKTIQQLQSPHQSEMAAIGEKIQLAILSYARHRYAHSCCMNMLSWALYAVLGSPILRDACIDYLSCGGDCATVPLDLLGGLDPSVRTLIIHYYSVMLHGAMNTIMGTDARGGSDQKMPISERVAKAMSFFFDWQRMQRVACLLGVSTIITMPLAVSEFFSIWRLVDPTSPLANISKLIKTMIYNTHFNGRQRKPVGL